MDEVTLYNMQGRADSARYAAEDAKTLALELMVKHLRFEHNMTKQDIATRCCLTSKQVKNILG